MGHLLSKNGYCLKKKRSGKLRKKKKRRNCFLRGPCMLCFIVRSTAESLEDDCPCPCPCESGAGAAAAAAASKLAERYVSLSSPEDCARFLLSPGELAVGWEGQGRRGLLSTVPARLIGAPALFRCSADYSEMVCKRKCGEPRRCTAPCKQPRCAFHDSPEEGEEERSASPSADQRLLPQLCPLPSSSSSSASSSEEESSGLGLQGTDSGESASSSAATPESSSFSCPLSHSDRSEEGKNTENTDTSRINHLPSSILLKVCALGVEGKAQPCSV